MGLEPYDLGRSPAVKTTTSRIRGFLDVFGQAYGLIRNCVGQASDMDAIPWRDAF